MFDGDKCLGKKRARKREWILFPSKVGHGRLQGLASRYEGIKWLTTWVGGRTSQAEGTASANTFKLYREAKTQGGQVIYPRRPTQDEKPSLTGVQDLDPCSAIFLGLMGSLKSIW